MLCRDGNGAGAVTCGTSADAGVVLASAVGVVLSVTCDAGGGSETVAVLPQQPMTMRPRMMVEPI